MDKAQWDKVEKRLRIQHCPVEMIIDGYEIYLILLPDKGLTQCISVYVNGYIKTEWALNDCEIRRRFYNRRTGCIFKGAELKKVSKAKRKALREKYTYEYFVPYWTSFSRMKNHFIKNNDTIELVKKI